MRPRWPERSTLGRSLTIVALTGAVLFAATEVLSDYRDTQLATGACLFAALAGLTVLAGLSGHVSLGHGALMAVGAYTAALLIGRGGWAVAPALAAAATVTASVGVPLGLAATRLQGPYLAGATLAFAVGLPALADRFPKLLGGENGLTVSTPVPPSALGPSFSLFRWEAWISCLGALIVLFVLHNVVHSGVGRSLRAVRDDEVAAALCGVRPGRAHTTAFVLSAACAGLSGGLLAAVVEQLASPGAFGVQLSLSLLAGVVVGGLGSLWGAAWGAALLVLLPNWTNDIASSVSLSNNVRNNMPLAIYGVVLIVAVLVWPSGIQGGLRVTGRRLRTRTAGVGLRSRSR